MKKELTDQEKREIEADAIELYPTFYGADARTDAARRAHIKAATAERIKSKVLIEALDKLADSMQRLFDEKKNNPKNKGCGLQNAWNNSAHHLYNAKKAITTYKNNNQ